MEGMIDFLVHNYMWFLVVTIILIFALIGYIVEVREYKKVKQFGGVSKEVELNFENLAKQAQNKTLNTTVMQNNGPSSMGNPSMMNSSGNMNMGTPLQNNSMNFSQSNMGNQPQNFGN